MAFDGITVAALVAETRHKLIGGRVSKIAQPEEGEILMTIKNGGESYRLLMSADASLPLYYLTSRNKQSPMNAPNFCMLLRKHIGSARITGISQPDFERVIDVSFEHLNEMGDLCSKHLMIELMGKHSNIIFCDEEGKILDSIKHVSSAVSSVREVLPGREYFIPQTTRKKNPLLETANGLIEVLKGCNQNLQKAVYTSYTGISPMVAAALILGADADPDMPFGALPEVNQERLADAFVSFFASVQKEEFSPVILYDGRGPSEYCAMEYALEGYSEKRHYESISELIEAYYEEKSVVTRMRQKGADLRHIVTTAIERNVKKYDLQLAQLRDTEDKDKYRIYGELLNTYGYGAKPGDKSLTAVNYYTNEEVVIPLDPQKSAQENAKRYFDKYGKLKRTREALEKLSAQTGQEIEHLKSVLMELDFARKEEELSEIRREMCECGYIRERSSKAKGKEKQKALSRPYHYVTSDGYHIYVGKNNYQNDELTFAKGSGGDYWFHAKKIPGSHVVLRDRGDEIPDHVFEIAAALAAYYSKGADQEKVEVDYTLRKNVKKPGGAQPGFVVYYTNYSMTIEPKIVDAVLEEQ